MFAAATATTLTRLETRPFLPPQTGRAVIESYRLVGEVNPAMDRIAEYPSLWNAPFELFFVSLPGRAG
jgi:hypothetical protein